jgi:NAD(P)H-dependent FMN reductase
MFKLQIIIGSTRSGRNSDQVSRWVIPAAQSQGAFQVEILDLRDWDLPMFEETIATLGDLSNPTYSDPIVKHWNEKIKEADAYIIITPEYNHSIPAVLKNAIDTVFFSYSFRYKPVAFVGYSLGLIAGARAVEHLTSIMVETEAVPVRTSTLIPLVTSAFNEQDQPINPGLNNTMDVMLDDLAWLAKTLKIGRNAGELLPPAALRLRKGK